MEEAKTFIATALRFFREQFFQGARHFLDIEFTRSTTTLVGDAALLPNNVHPVGHGVEGTADGVINVIDKHWDREFQIDRAGDGNFLAALERLGLLNLQRGRPG